MKYLVTIKATVKKTIEVEAKTATEAGANALAVYESKDHEWSDIDVYTVHEKIEGYDHA